MIHGIMDAIGDDTHVLAVSSSRDAHSTMVYPTHPNRLSRNYNNLTLLPDPCLIDLNGLTIGITSTDIIGHINDAEIAVGVPDKIKRCINYMFHQKTFYPLNPPSLDVYLDSELAAKYAQLNQIPNMLIVPSDTSLNKQKTNDNEYLSTEDFDEASWHEDRGHPPSVIILVDVDCFEVQVWQKRKRVSEDVPYLTANEDGIITSVNYPAKRKGVSRNMSLAAAKKICPDLEIIPIRYRYGKPDTQRPRFASDKIADQFKEFFTLMKNSIVSKESKDEFLVDVTQEVARRMKVNNYALFASDLKQLPDHTFLLHHRCRINILQNGFNFRILQVLAKSRRVDHRQELALVHGAIIANQLMQFVKQTAGFQCSAGIGHNILTAKMSCGKGKPAGIAMMPITAIQMASKSTSIPDIPGLGGDKGQKIMKHFKIKTMYELSQIPINDLVKLVGVRAYHFHEYSIGNDSRRVIEKEMSQNISCGKSLKGRRRITRKSDIFPHLYLLVAEMHERIEYEKVRNDREPIAFKLEIHVCQPNGYRGGNRKPLLKKTYLHKDPVVEKRKLFLYFKSIILEHQPEITDTVAEKIVHLNIIAKFGNKGEDLAVGTTN